VGACCGFRSATFPGQTGASGNSKAEFEKKAYTAWKATVSDRTLKTFIADNLSFARKPTSQFTFTLVSTDSWRARYQSAIVVLANSRDRRRAPYPAGGMVSSWSDILLGYGGHAGDVGRRVFAGGCRKGYKGGGFSRPALYRISGECCYNSSGLGAFQGGDIPEGASEGALGAGGMLVVIFLNLLVTEGTFSFACVKPSMRAFRGHHTPAKTHSLGYVKPQGLLQHRQLHRIFSIILFTSLSIARLLSEWCISTVRSYPYLLVDFVGSCGDIYFVLLLLLYTWLHFFLLLIHF